MAVAEKLDTRHKALAVNLDAHRYGTFAEIGAGQEVVRWFFAVGAASGTIAKSISAYDMQVSDAIYGKSPRYVCRDRLQTMLDYEYDLNVERLAKKRGRSTCFFAFADTVSASRYGSNEPGNAWMGIRFQARPQDDPSQIMIHVRLLDSENHQQQEALGIVGVNLVYGAAFLSHNPDALLESLLDDLSVKRIEIGMIEFSGIEFRRVDNRVMSLRLVQLGLSEAAMFASDDRVLQPSEVLHKKPVLVQRGSFRPLTNVHVDIQKTAHELFCAEPDVNEAEVVSLLEITMSNLRAEGEIDLGDFIDRVDVLCATGLTVLISDYSEYYRLAEFLCRYTSERIGLALGASTLQELFQERYYEALDGLALEAASRLFKRKVKLYVYPALAGDGSTVWRCSNLTVPPEMAKLYEFLLERCFLVDLEKANTDYLPIRSVDVLGQIRSGDEAWEQKVPDMVVDLVKQRGLFGYRD